LRSTSRDPLACPIAAKRQGPISAKRRVEPIMELQARLTCPSSWVFHIMNGHTLELRAKMVKFRGKKMKVPTTIRQLVDPSGRMNASTNGDKENSHDPCSLTPQSHE